MLTFFITLFFFFFCALEYGKLLLHSEINRFKLWKDRKANENFKNTLKLYLLEIPGFKYDLSTWNIDFPSKPFILAINKIINTNDNNNLHLYYYTGFKFSIKMINKSRNRS